MPYKFQTEKIKLPKGKDRRYKLTEADIVRIRELHAMGYPIREIARMMEGVCSRRTIQLTIYPERREKMRENARLWRLENGNTLQRYGRKEWSKTMREHRRYKFSILNMKKTKKKDVKRPLFVSIMYLLIIVQALTVIFLAITIFLDLFYT